MKIKIYHIIDPNTRKPVYVGQTMHDLRFRMHSHLSNPNNSRFGELVERLKKKNQKPIIELIEEVTESKANKREQYWIDEYRRNGIDLTNCKNRLPHNRKRQACREKLEREQAQKDVIK